MNEPLPDGRIPIKAIHHGGPHDGYVGWKFMEPTKFSVVSLFCGIRRRKGVPVLLHDYRGDHFDLADEEIKVFYRGTIPVEPDFSHWFEGIQT